MPAAQVVTSPPRKKFTSAEVERMRESGIFDGQRYELIDGDLVEKMGQNPPHAYAIQLVLDWLSLIFKIRQLRVQLPIEVALQDQPRSVPEPDLAVLAEAKTEYQFRHPSGHELLLAVEVADSSSIFDQTFKAGLYARAGLPEYWVLDIANRRLLVHTHPLNGKYRQVTQLEEEETVSLNSVGVLVSELLPEPIQEAL